MRRIGYRKDDKPPLKGRGRGHVTHFSISTPALISPERLKWQLPNFVYIKCLVFDDRLLP